LEEFSRELLDIDDVWTYLSNMCAESSERRPLTKTPDMRIPRACGLAGTHTECAPPHHSEEAADRLDFGTTTVTGNRELPKVMYVVPWKKSDLGDLPAGADHRSACSGNCRGVT
jgi:hypothetical protein